ncbi:hypothetical protein DET1239 [Dehalococcoides mccartyi 195]|uniref:Uncharacterized protein n=1 Tax=Dehalococcoides mccartyi (strain ATCC BAA-2266 / KCTC 15142 / 195) TaxID=243164 RepID=Q3Z747_DEHM1|nr:hypothetical protein DET1239 [Dehalococcoides mccartyi 195]
MRNLYLFMVSEKAVFFQLLFGILYLKTGWLHRKGRHHSRPF